MNRGGLNSTINPKKDDERIPSNKQVATIIGNVLEF